MHYLAFSFSYLFIRILIINFVLLKGTWALSSVHGRNVQSQWWMWVC